jgi:hypothetical protein
MSRKSLFILLAPILLSACAAPIRTPLADANRNVIKSTKAHIAIVQDEVQVDVTVSNTAPAMAAFGLVGTVIALTIDSKVTNNRMQSTQLLLEEFYSRIDDLDFRKMFNDVMTKRAADYPFKVTDVSISPRTLSVVDIKQKLSTSSTDDALLVVYPRYRLSSDFKYVFGTASISLWLKGKDELQYFGQVIYQSKPLGLGGVDSLSEWSKADGKEFRSILNEAADELAHLIVTDVNVNSDVKPDEVRTFPIGFSAPAVPVEAVGKVVSQIPGRVRVISKDGYYFSLPRASN